MAEFDNVYPTDLEMLATELQVAEEAARKYQALVHGLEDHLSQPESGRAVDETRHLDHKLSETRAKYIDALNSIARITTRQMLLENPDLTTAETSDKQLEEARARRDEGATNGAADPATDEPEPTSEVDDSQTPDEEPLAEIRATVHLNVNTLPHEEPPTEILPAVHLDVTIVPDEEPRAEILPPVRTFDLKPTVGAEADDIDVADETDLLAEESPVELDSDDPDETPAVADPPPKSGKQKRSSKSGQKTTSQPTADSKPSKRAANRGHRTAKLSRREQLENYRAQQKEKAKPKGLIVPPGIRADLFRYLMGHHGPERVAHFSNKHMRQVINAIGDRTDRPKDFEERVLRIQQGR